MDILLKNWGLSHLCDIFQVNDIKRVDDLSDLLNECNSSDFHKLISSILNQIKLRRHFNEYISNKTVNVDSASIFNAENVDETINESIIVHVINIPEKNENVIVIADANTSKDSLIEEKKRPHEPLTKKIKLNIKSIEFDLKEVLSKTAYGNSLLLINKHGGNISSQCQSILCDIIISYFLNLNIRTLKNEDFEKIAEEIIDLFPNECKETYYMPPVRKKDSKIDKAGISRGKLVDKFRNALRFIRSAEKVNDNKNQTEQNITDVDQADKDQRIAEENRIWLIHNQKPQEEVNKKWDASYILRVEDCANKIYKNSNDILIKWPILKLDSAYLLIERDFDIKFPKHKEPT